MKKRKGGQADISIATAGHIDHGKTTLVQAITGVWTSKYTEELRRGITIKLGYALTTIWKRKNVDPPSCYFSALETEEDADPLRKISFVDVPGHEMLMTVMISGAELVDGCLFVIAANEPCPRPQTKEHLKVLEICGIRNIVIAQNKIDTVDRERAKENYEEIKNFIQGTIAEDAPIIPVSAQFSVNIDVLLEAIERFIPTPERDLESDPLFLIARSFDVNLTGKDPEKLIGGVIGGVLKRGKLKVGDEIEIRPGFIDEKGNWEPIFTKIESISAGDELIDEAAPGGSIGIATQLDPYLTKEDRLVGNVAGKPDRLPPVFNHLELDITLLERVVGTEKELEMAPLQKKEKLLINAWTAKSIGVIERIGDGVEVSLKYPICIEEGERVAISRRIAGKWRLAGYGIIG